MRMMKRTLSLLLASMMILSCLSGVVFADSPVADFTMSFEFEPVSESDNSLSIADGDAEFFLNIVNNNAADPYSGIQFELHYDTEKFTLMTGKDDYTCGFDGSFSVTKKTYGCKVLWYNMSEDVFSTEVDTMDFAKLKFVAKQEALIDEYNDTYTFEIQNTVFGNMNKDKYVTSGIANPEISIVGGKVPADLGTATVSYANPEFKAVYTGEEIAAPELVVKIGDETVDPENYTVTGDLKGTDAKKDYTLTIAPAEGVKAYTGSTTKTWEIEPAQLIDPELAEDEIVVLRNGNAFALPGVAAKTKPVAEGNDITVSYALADGETKVAFADENKNSLKGLVDGTTTVTATISAPNHYDVKLPIAVTVQYKKNVTVTAKAEDYAAFNHYEAVKDGKTVDNFVSDMTVTPATVDEATKTYVLKKQTSADPEAYETIGTYTSYEDLSKVIINDVGTYKVEYTYEDIDEKGSATPVKFVINKTTIDVSAVKWQNEVNYTYAEGTEREVKLVNVPDYVTEAYDGNKATNAGEYDATASLSVDTTKYVLNGVTSFATKWVINPQTVTLTDAQKAYTKEFTYDKNTKNVAFTALPSWVKVEFVEDEAYTYEAVNAGNYDGQAKLTSNDTNYVLDGEDGVVTIDLAWSIAKAAALNVTVEKTIMYNETNVLEFLLADIKADAGNIAVDGEVAKVDETSGKISHEMTATGIKYSIAGATEVDKEKTYTLSFDFTSDNYEKSSFTLVITIIDKNLIDADKLTIAESKEVTYAGQAWGVDNVDLIAVKSDADFAEGDSNWTVSYKFYEEDGETYVGETVADAGNYKVEATIQDSKNIYTTAKKIPFTVKQAELAVKNVTVEGKPYDGTASANATVTFEKTYDANVATISATFKDANAGTQNVDYVITVTNDNYTLAEAAKTGTKTAVISKRELTVTGLTAANKDYDGTTKATINYEAAALGNIANGEAVVISGVTGHFVDANAADSVAVMIDSVTLKIGEEAAANYTVDCSKIDGVAAKISVVEVTEDNTEFTYNKEELDKPYDATQEALTEDDVKEMLKDTLTSAFKGDEENEPVAVDEYEDIVITKDGEEVTSFDGTPGVYVVTATAKISTTNMSGNVPVRVEFEISKSQVTIELAEEIDGETTLGEAAKFVDEYGNEVAGTVTWKNDKNEVNSTDKVEANVKYTYTFEPDEEEFYVGTSGEVVLFEVVEYQPSNANLSSGSTAHGSVKVTPYDPEKGDKVVITVKPAAGYEVAKVTVTNGKKVVDVHQLSATQFAFVMPAGTVDIDIEYKKAETVKFTDVASNAWYHDAVYAAVGMGLFNGVTETTFNPNGSMTRGMLVTVLWRLAGAPAAASSSFKDVADGSWYDQAVAWANAKGVVTGMSDSEFAPNAAMTREQMAAMLYRYAKLVGLNTAKKADLSAYTDAANVSDWAEEAMAWAVANGLINGVSETTLAPAATATRAQVATILVRFAEKFGL